MSQNWWFRTLFVLLLVLLAGMALMPSVVEMYVYPENVEAQNQDAAAVGGVESVRVPELPQWYDTYQSWFNMKTLALGLDLQGGLMLRYSVDIDSAIDEKLSRFAAEIKTVLAQRGASIDYRVDREQDFINIKFDVPAKAELVDTTFMQDYPVLQVVATSDDGTVVLGLRDNYLTETEKSSVKQAVEIVRERIDELGVASPSVRVEGGRNIVVELPGLSSKRAADAEKLISTTAVLTFKLVADDEQENELFSRLGKELSADSKVELYRGTQLRAKDVMDQDGRLVQSGREILKEFSREYESSVPSGREIVYEKLDERTLSYEGVKVKPGDPTIWRMRLVRNDIPVLTGDNVDDAYPATNPDTNQPFVSLKLDRKGGDVFYEITKEHVGDKLAILMDDSLVSDPVIRSEIPGGNVSIEMGRGNRQETLTEVQNLVVSLRSGALPAPIRQEYKTLIGPSLGADSVEKGSKALLWGFVAVFVFMIIYYKLGGIIASIALLINLLFIMAGMASLGAALTMPGIAGIILTVGMAVDANVIIFERIREELRAGETTRKAVQLGYEKALWTILDSNITTGIAAVILMQFGSGPVKGFAITLLMGLVSSVFTAFFVTRLIFELYTSKNENAKLPL